MKFRHSRLQTDNGCELVGNWQAKADSEFTKAVEANRGKEQQTPWDIIHDKEPQVSAAICTLPPVFLDELFMRKLDATLVWGYDVIPYPCHGRGRATELFRALCPFGPLPPGPVSA